MHRNTNIRNLREALSKKDHSFFEDIYAMYRSDFLSFAANKFNCDNNEATDVFQDAVIALYENIRDGKITVFESSIKTYLFSIAKYKLLNNIQKKFIMVTFALMK